MSDPSLGARPAYIWRKNPQQLRVYSRASSVWVGVFATRLVVQLPFYLAGSLGIAGQGFRSIAGKA